MSIFKKLSLFFILTSSIGIIYTIYMLKDMPDIFEFDIDDIERADYDREI